MHHFTRLFPAAAVGFTGQSLVSHAGTEILTELIDALGFRGLCEDRLGQFAPSGARHRPGRLIGSLAVMLAAGGEHGTDLDMLRSSPGTSDWCPRTRPCPGFSNAPPPTPNCSATASRPCSPWYCSTGSSTVSK